MPEQSLRCWGGLAHVRRSGTGRGLCWQRQEHAARIGLEELDREEDDGADKSDQEPEVDEPKVDEPKVDGGSAIRVLNSHAFRVERSNLGLDSLRGHLGHLETGTERTWPAASAVKCLLADWHWHRPFGQCSSENG